MTDSQDGGQGSVAGQEVAIFGAGCFWCIEAALQQIEGVICVESGYMGGHVEDPSYEEVCTGTTGHAEVVKVTFDPRTLAYDDLLQWFWKLHDPTTRNQQGNDIGPQYRSAIFYGSDTQRKVAHRSRQELGASGDIPAPIVTDITEAGPFYSAGVSHQDYYRLNRLQPYCRLVIAPKLKKAGLDS